MTPESVLEKLKELNSLHDQSYADYLEVLDLFETELLPRLIAALELVEAKAKESTSAHLYDFNLYDYADSSVNDAFDLGVETGLIDFAREVLAVLNNKDNKEPCE